MGVKHLGRKGNCVCVPTDDVGFYSGPTLINYTRVEDCSCRTIFTTFSYSPTITSVITSVFMYWSIQYYYSLCQEVWLDLDGSGGCEMKLGLHLELTVLSEFYGKKINKIKM